MTETRDLIEEDTCRKGQEFVEQVCQRSKETLGFPELINCSSVRHNTQITTTIIILADAFPNKCICNWHQK